MTKVDDEQLVIDCLNDYYATWTEEDAKADLQEKYGEVWNDAELVENFGVQFFDGGAVHVIRKDSGKSGTVAYLKKPRLYFSFVPKLRNDE
jgi:hypothetical protein